MRHTALFNGIGGFMLAAQWVGWENVDSVEIDPWCNKIIEKNFPNVKRYGDIKEYKGVKGSADIISGGFPCQPFSHAGKRQGESDDRYLWPEYLRIIREIQPSYVVGENVAGLISMEDGGTLDGILLDLEGEGYETEQFIIPACGVGAWHRRDRIWIIAYTEGVRLARQKLNPQRGATVRTNPMRETKFNNASNASSQGPQKWKGQNSGRKGTYSRSKPGGNEWWATEPDVGRVANGIPRRVDRLKGLGNAIVPQVAFEIFKAIEQLNKGD